MCVAVCASSECVKLFAGIFLPRACVYVCTLYDVHGFALVSIFYHSFLCTTLSQISMRYTTRTFSHQFSLSYLDAMCLTLVVICILLSFMTLKTGITIKLQFVNCGVTRFQCKLFIPLILLCLCSIHKHTSTHSYMYVMYVFRIMLTKLFLLQVNYSIRSDFFTIPSPLLLHFIFILVLLVMVTRAHANIHTYTA